MSDSFKLTVELLDFWHCGTGKGSGEFLDAVVERDRVGLPYVPGKMLKGLLRDAVGLCEAWGHVDRGLQRVLFGSDAFDERTGQPAQPASPGALLVSNACLPTVLTAWLAHPGNASYRLALFRDVFSTAVDVESGVAEGKSLRGMEVTVPMTLEAEIKPMPGQIPPAGWQSQLALALPLVGAVGQQRSRGLGRCILQPVREP